MYAPHAAQQESPRQGSSLQNRLLCLRRPLWPGCFLHVWGQSPEGFEHPRPDTPWWALACHLTGVRRCPDCPFRLPHIVTQLGLQILPRLGCWAHVSLGHLNNWFNVRLISGNDSSLFAWRGSATALDSPTGKIQQEVLGLSHLHGRVLGVGGCQGAWPESPAQIRQSVPGDRGTFSQGGSQFLKGFLEPLGLRSSHSSDGPAPALPEQTVHSCLRAGWRALVCAGRSPRGVCPRISTLVTSSSLCFPHPNKPNNRNTFCFLQHPHPVPASGSPGLEFVPHVVPFWLGPLCSPQRVCLPGQGTLPPAFHQEAGTGPILARPGDREKLLLTAQSVGEAPDTPAQAGRSRSPSRKMGWRGRP